MRSIVAASRPMTRSYSYVPQRLQPLAKLSFSSALIDRRAPSCFAVFYLSCFSGNQIRSFRKASSTNASHVRLSDTSEAGRSAHITDDAAR